MMPVSLPAEGAELSYNTENYNKFYKKYSRGQIMLGRSNGDNDSQTSGVLIQYLHDISVYLREVNISRKTTVLAAAILVLAGLLGVRYREAGTILPTSSAAGGKELPIYCVQTEEPKIALTFDAAWGNDDTQKIMEILKKHDVKVTFFMTGGWVESYPEDVKMILAEGHDLGNHSQNHKNMSQLSDAEKEEELMSVHDKVKELTGYDMFLFRPPYGDYDTKLMKVARKCNYYPIQWDVDSLDWKDYGADSIIKTVAQNEHLGNGSIILCHNGARYTAEALDVLIKTLKEAGYQFVPVSELIYRDNYYMDHEGRQIPGKKER